MKIAFYDIIKYLGYTTAKMYLSNNKNYFECRNMLYNNRNVQHYNYNEDNKKIKISKLKKIVKSNILLEGVNKTASYINTKKFNDYLNSKHNNLDSKVKNINIFNIPTEYGICSHTSFNVTVNKTKPISVKKIYLENSLQHNNFLLENYYIHELGHILMLRNKGSVFNYLHHEFIPISLELLYSYINNSEDGLNLIMANRLENTSQLITCNYSSYEEYVRNNSYILSSLLSFQLLEKYLDFNTNQKIEMRNRLKDCLNGKIMVEEFMNDYDIGFNNDNSIKYLKRTIYRSKSR